MPNAEVTVHPPDLEQRQRRKPLGFYRNSYLYFSLALLTAFVGFYESYFARLADTDLVHHLHGVMATTWLLMLIAQAWLMRVGLRQVHKLLGWGSLIIAPLFILSGVLMIPIQTFAKDPFSQRFGVPLAFLDGANILYFSVAYVLAIVYRRKLQLHARYMASTAILVLPPALSRAMGFTLPFIRSFPVALHSAYAVSELIVVLLLFSDYRAGKIQTPYVLLLANLVVQQVGFALLL